MAPKKQKYKEGNDPRDTPPPSIFGEELSGDYDWWMASFIQYAVHESGRAEGSSSNGDYVILDERKELLGQSRFEV